MLLLCLLFLSLRVSASDADVLPTQSQAALQATPSPTTNYTPPNSNTSFEPYLLLTTELSINQIRPNGRNIRVLIPELGNAVDFDIRRGTMCWSVVSRGKITCSKLDGSEQFEVLSTASWTIDAIAVDWITQKLYWADAEAKQILVLDLITRLGKVIANTGNQTLPRSLVVDPTRRWLYWSDSGNQPKIERLSMDGTNRETLHSSGLGAPNALTIDYGTQTLYWTDSVTRDIKCSSTDGSGRQIVTSAVFWPYSITLSADSLYWTDWEYNAVFQATMSGRNTSFLISGLSSRPKGIRYISYDSQPSASNPCAVNNGGCSHLCLLSSASPSNYTCSCPEGYVSTNANQSSCIAPSNASNFSGSCVSAGYQSCCTSGLCLGYLGDCSCSINCYVHGTCCADINQTCSSTAGPPPSVFFSDNNSLYSMGLDGSNLSVVLTGLSYVSALDFDYRQGHLYWTELNPPTIWKSAINGSFKEILVNTNISTPAGLAVDWVSNKVYWTDEDLSTIEVLDPMRKSRRVLFKTGLSGSPGFPRAIVLDPITRWLYWTDWSSTPMIGRASMDGTSRTVVQDYNLGYPNALALDYATQRLYWGDGGLTWVESSWVDGSDRQVLYQSVDLYPYSMVLFGRTLYISNWIGMRVVTVGTSGVSSMEAIYNNPEYSPKGIRVVSRNVQIEGTNPCALNNGGCTHLCLLSSVQEAGFTCNCPGGTMLNSTQGVCESVLPSPPPTPTLQGSCKRAGYTACCPTSSCIGSPQEADCYCDHLCYKFRDCCPDISETCPSLLSSATPTPSSTLTVLVNTTVGTLSETILSTPTASHLMSTGKYTSAIVTHTPSSRPTETQRDYTTNVLATTIVAMVIILFLLVLILGVSIALRIHGRTIKQLTYSTGVTEKSLVQAQQLG